MQQGIDKERIAAAVCEIIAALGIDPLQPELQETPERVAAAFQEWCAGIGASARENLRKELIADSAGELVALRGVELTSLCEHHLLPFCGIAHIVYHPTTQIAGLGALARAVQTVAARPQLQERLGQQIAAEIAAGLGARGILVVLEARHGCLSERGQKQKQAKAVTVAATGSLQSGQARYEALLLLQTAVPELSSVRS